MATLTGISDCNARKQANQKTSSTSGGKLNPPFLGHSGG